MLEYILCSAESCSAPLLELSEYYLVWGIFWATYFGASYLFPMDQVKTRPRAQITREKVRNRLILNCAVTATIVPLVAHVPQLLFFSDTWLGTFAKFSMIPLMSEIWFYYTHRLMHSKWFYRWHADHHAFIQSCAIAGLYCSPIEMILVNQLSVSVPFRILGLSLGELIFANMGVALSVLRGHAGLHFRDDLPKWIPRDMVTALDHDIHHHTLKNNYGVFYILDRIHGTYKPELEDSNDKITCK